MAETELTSNPTPAILYEYIWFGGQPVAQVDSAGTTSWTFTDHLGTPLIQTSSVQGITWRAEHEPYGKVECDDVRRAFAGKDWRSLRADDLLQNKEALDFMTPRAFRFYLPAYLRFSPGSGDNRGTPASSSARAT